MKKRDYSDYNKQRVDFFEILMAVEKGRELPLCVQNWAEESEANAFYVERLRYMRGNNRLEAMVERVVNAIKAGDLEEDGCPGSKDIHLAMPQAVAFIH